MDQYTASALSHTISYQQELYQDASPAPFPSMPFLEWHGWMHRQLQTQSHTGFQNLITKSTVGDIPTQNNRASDSITRP